MECASSALARVLSDSSKLLMNCQLVKRKSSNLARAAREATPGQLSDGVNESSLGNTCDLGGLNSSEMVKERGGLRS